jgi:hypothetical protein
VTQQRKLLTVEELDAMTPAERETVFAERVVGNLDDLPAEVRDRFMEHGRRLSRELHSSAE